MNNRRRHLVLALILTSAGLLNLGCVLFLDGDGWLRLLNGGSAALMAGMAGGRFRMAYRDETDPQ